MPTVTRYKETLYTDGKMNKLPQRLRHFNPDNPLGREMMARQVARQFCCLGEAHSAAYGRRASGKNGRKLTASTRVGAERRLMDYPGLTHNHCRDIEENNMKTVRQIIESRTVLSIAPDASVYDALVIMAEKHIGALLVLKGEELVGIFSERDYARCIVLKGKTSRDTLISEVMTGQQYLITVTPKNTVEECLDLVSAKRIRHLPVMENGKVVGIVSIGDLVKETIEYQKFLIQQLESYIKG
jgi:CBS domain-containing protein